MNNIRRFLLITLPLFFLLTPQNTLHASDRCEAQADSCHPGYAYAECRRAPNISPSYVLALVITTTVLTVIFGRGSNSHSHSGQSDEKAADGNNS